MKILRSVLLAEDEPNDIFLLQHAFEQAEVLNPLHTVNDGQEAIDYLSGSGNFADRAQFPIPSLVILDVKMPRKSGIEVLAWLRQQKGLGCLPVLILSSSAHPDDVEKAYQLGANAFVVKPPGVAQRTELAKMLKGFWLSMNELPTICR